MMLWGSSSLLLVRPVQTPAPEPLGDAAVAPCPALAGRHGGTFLCPDFKACCCIYRASRLGNPGGLEQWQQLPCSPALPGSRCPLGREKCPCPPRRNQGTCWGHGLLFLLACCTQTPSFLLVPQICAVPCSEIWCLAIPMVRHLGASSEQPLWFLAVVSALV